MSELFKQKRECGNSQEIPLLIPSSPDISTKPRHSPTRLTILPRPVTLPSVNLDVQVPQRSFHERYENYMKVRNRIFNENSTTPDSFTENNFVPTKRYEKLVSFRNSSKTKFKAEKVIASISKLSFSDDRPFANIEIEGEPLLGLLDSGANISVLGKDSLDFLKSIGKHFTKFSSDVATSDGTKQSIVGFIDLQVKYKDLEKFHQFFVVPTLKQQLYLGFDFWKSFGIAPELHNFQINEVSFSEIFEESSEVSPEPPEREAHSLSPEQSFRLEQVKSLFPSSTKLGLGHTPLLSHKIDTGDAEPIKARHYPVSPNVQKLMFEELDRMISLGVIEEAESPWNSPVVLVRKPGKNRLCLDSRRLNAVTKKLAYALPNINNLLSRLSDTYYISCIDLKDAFWQLELDQASREKTAFSVPGRPQYQYCVMPFGLCNAAQRLCQLMDKVFPVTLRSKVFVYLDDLLVVSSSFEEHIRILTDVATKLRNAGLTVNIAKSRFCYKEVKYLGHIVGHGTIRPDPDKISAIVNFPVPTSVRQVRRFMGMCGYYGKFVENYSSLSSPITDTIRKHAKFTFTAEALESFHKLKEALVCEPVLVHPNFEEPFFIHCDASKYGVGACLMQKDSEGNDRAICFFSKKLNNSQRNYSVTELECLAAILAVEKFRPYIELHPFSIVTDHSALKWLMDQKDLSGRLARWSLRLQRYEFTIQHRKGNLNVVPDALSREGDVAEISHTMPLVDLKSPAFLSEEYKSLQKVVEEKGASLPDIRISDGYVYKRLLPRTGKEVDEVNLWKLWVPSELTSSLIADAHNCDDGLHNGRAKTIHKLRQLYFWPKLNSQVNAYVDACEKCKCCKRSIQVLRTPMGKPFIVERPFQHLYMDYIGPYPRTKAGYIQLLVVLDQLTKYPIFIPLRQANSLLTIDGLEKNVFSIFGVPQTVLTDRGTQFMSENFQKFLQTYGVTHLPTSTHSPQANASERLNQSIIQGIRLQLEKDHTKWDQGLTNIAFALRSSVHSTTGMSPYFALFGNNMVCHGSSYKLLHKLGCLQEDIEIPTQKDKMRRIHDELMEKISEAHEKNERRYNLRTRKRKFSVGQIVFRRLFHQSDLAKHFNAKFAPKFGKSRVKEVISDNRILLEDLNGKVIGPYHSKDIKF